MNVAENCEKLAQDLVWIFGGVPGFPILNLALLFLYIFQFNKKKFIFINRNRNESE